MVGPGFGFRWVSVTEVDARDPHRNLANDRRFTEGSVLLGRGPPGTYYGQELWSTSALRVAGSTLLALPVLGPAPRYRVGAAVLHLTAGLTSRGWQNPVLGVVLDARSWVALVLLGSRLADRIRLDDARVSYQTGKREE
jgi:hypothetical protein